MINEDGRQVINVVANITLDLPGFAEYMVATSDQIDAMMRTLIEGFGLTDPADIAAFAAGMISMHQLCNSPDIPADTLKAITLMQIRAVAIRARATLAEH